MCIPFAAVQFDLAHRSSTTPFVTPAWDFPNFFGGAPPGTVISAVKLGPAFVTLPTGFRFDSTTAKNPRVSGTNADIWETCPDLISPI